MLTKVTEKTMHAIRWAITCGWLLLILSLFFDPISAWLTDPTNTLSPLHIKPEICILVQGQCIEQTPYPLGASLFWGLIVPLGIFILLVFGHEFWRRICPLSFLSQIPRALGKQRTIKKVDAKTGQIRHELVKIKPDSWLGRNSIYLQFGLLYAGVCGRVLFLDADRLILGLFLLLTIVSAITVGYLYAGKTWCHYFCPMGGVQLFYGEPRGLFTHTAHDTEKNPITQSMCRRISPEGKEESACVACNSPCMDIDAERSYWNHLDRSDYKFLYYGYVGLVIGFFLCYYFYSGNWNYFLSGAWSRQPNQLGTLFAPGFYLLETAIPIPRLVAVPLIIGLAIALTYLVGKQLEKPYKSWQLQNNPSLTPDRVQHQIFTLCTFATFNFFFIFAGRSYVNKLPVKFQYLWEILLVITSTLWLYRTWGRSPETYSRESLASRLRKQLTKLQLDVSRFLDGRSLDSLNADEVYVLAKILPGFSGEKRLQAYKGVLKDALEEGYVNSASSLEVLQQMRQELGVSEQEHLQAITELGIEDPDLFDPNQQRSRENQSRIEGFRQQIRGLVSQKRRRGATGLGKELLKVVKKEKSIHSVLSRDNFDSRSLSREYGVTPEEEAKILAELDPDLKFARRTEVLAVQLQQIADGYQTLERTKATLSYHPRLTTALGLLQTTLTRKQEVMVKGVLEMLSAIEPSPAATKIALIVATLAPETTHKLLHDRAANWQERLPSLIGDRLEKQAHLSRSIAINSSDLDISSYVETFLTEADSLTKAVGLYVLARLQGDRGQQQARQLLDSHLMLNPLVRETARSILAPDPDSPSTLEKLLYLANTDLFSSLKTDSLIDLAYQTKVRQVEPKAIVLEKGTLATELLLLIRGRVTAATGEEVYHPVCILNETAILARIAQPVTLMATEEDTAFLAIERDWFEERLQVDRDFARGILERESQKQLEKSFTR
jgi:hypothetical protein